MANGQISLIFIVCDLCYAAMCRLNKNHIYYIIGSTSIDLNILGNFGGLDKNNLQNLINSSFSEDEDI